MTPIETILWYLGNILDYTLEMLPCMAFSLVIFLCLRTSRMARISQKGLVSPQRRELALLLFVMFLAGLAALTLFPAYFWNLGHLELVFRGEIPLFPKVDWRFQLQTMQLTPFQEIKRAFKGPWVMFLMVANIGIFAPVGFFPALLWRKGRWWKSLAIGFLSSFFIEVIQLFVGRSTDIDDIILNTAGALAGYWLFRLLRALFPRFTSQFQCREREDTPNGLPV